MLASCFEDPLPAGTGGSSGDDDTAAASASGGDDDGSSAGVTSATGGMSGSTATETTGDTSTGDTSMGDTTADETGPPPGGCGEAFECIVPPAGWSGPVLVSMAPGNDAPPPCPPSSGTEVVLQRGLPPGPAQCECTCDDPEGVLCPQPAGSVGVSTTAGATCGEVGPSIDIAAMCSGNAAPAFTAVAFGTAVLSPGDEGACAEVPNNSIPPVVIDESIRVCGDGITAEPCEGGGVCAPDLPGVGSFRRCVVRDGAHACPPEFPDVRSGFQSYLDDRGCSACSCSPPTAMCTPVVGLHSADGCASLVDTLMPEECVDGVAVESYSFFNSVSGSCEAGGGTPQGSFQPQDITSVCCEP